MLLVVVMAAVAVVLATSVVTLTPCLAEQVAVAVVVAGELLVVLPSTDPPEVVVGVWRLTGIRPLSL